MSRPTTPSFVINSPTKWVDDEVAAQIEIEKLEEILVKQPDNVTHLCRMFTLQMASGKTRKAKPVLEHVVKCTKLTLQNPSLGTAGSKVVIDTLLSYWKAERYRKKKGEVDLFLNISDERKKVLKDLHDIMRSCTASKNDLALKLAYIEEASGETTKSLAILSDLIADETTSSKMDLSYVIFKAAIILKHIGQERQAMEYMEFLIDDPPAEGFSKTHVLAFLILLYETGEPKYKVFLPSAYTEMFNSYKSDLNASTATKKSLNLNQAQQTNKKLDTLQQTISTTSDIWEILAIQAIDKCEYIMAIQLLLAAVAKAPSKPKLHYLLCELYVLVEDKKKAIKHGECSLAMKPTNIDLRNLLLLLNPAKYVDTLRMAPASKGEDDGMDMIDIGVEGGGRGTGGKKKGIHQKLRAQIEAHRQEGDAAIERGESPNRSLLSRVTSKVIAITGITSPPRSRSGSRGVLGLLGLGGVKDKELTVDEKQQLGKIKKKYKKKNLAPGKHLEESEKGIESVNPYRPARPALPKGAKNILRLALHGNNTVHYYDEILDFIVEMRENAYVD